MGHKVYALYSEKYNKIYIGQTSCIDKRLKWHNELSVQGWTVKFRPWKIIYTEKMGSRFLALKRERQLKTARGRLFVWGKVKEYIAGWSSW